MTAKEAISQVDWELYKRRLVETIPQILRQFFPIGDSGRSGGSLYQLAIMSDSQASETTLAVDTFSNAQSQKAELLEFLRNQSGWATAASADAEELRPYSSSPEDFEFSQLATIRHPELDVANRLDPVERGIFDGAVEHHTLQAADEILVAGGFQGISREPEIWVGISSPRDWFDHARRL